MFSHFPRATCNSSFKELEESYCVPNVYYLKESRYDLNIFKMNWKFLAPSMTRVAYMQLHKDKVCNFFINILILKWNECYKDVCYSTSRTLAVEHYGLTMNDQFYSGTVT